MADETPTLGPARILIAQIDAQIRNLERIKNVVDHEAIEGKYSLASGKFRRVANPQLKALEKLKKRVKAVEDGREPVENLAQYWETYLPLRRHAQRAYNQCLDYLGGIAVRAMKLDGGMSDHAESLVTEYYAKKTGVTWGSVMIVGEERLFDDVSKITEIIRLRFPEWDIWNLPFTAQEFGQLIASKEEEGLLDFFRDELHSIENAIRDQDVAQDDCDELGVQNVNELARPIVDLREGYQEARESQENEARVASFLVMQQNHMRKLFADAFATYFLGPAYIYAQLILRLMPIGPAKDEQHKPSHTRRVAFTLGILQKMNDKTKRSAEDVGIYANELVQIRSLWKSTMQAIEPVFESELSFGQPYDDWVHKVYEKLSSEFGDDGFTPKDWQAAEDLSMEILNDDFIRDESLASAASHTLPVILNAFWKCRLANPDRLAKIEDRAQDLIDTLARLGTPDVTTPPIRTPQHRSESRGTAPRGSPGER